MRRSSANPVPIAALACGVLAIACGGDNRAEVPAAVTRFQSDCASRASGTRWAVPGRMHSLTKLHGRTEEEWLGNTIAGLEYRAGTDHLYAYDANNSRVLVLNKDFRRVREIGRKGSGPGELSALQIPGTDRLALTDSALHVLDIRAVHVFTPDGSFIQYAPGARPGSLRQPQRIQALDVGGGDVLVVVDSVDLYRGKRKLQVRSVEAGNEVLYELTAAPLPKINGRYTTGTAELNQAVPLATLHDNCVIALDGTSALAVRYSLPSAVEDTIPLPNHQLPPETSADVRRREQMREVLSRVMPATQRGESTGPTARRRWERMAVDPDGYLWLQPWRPWSMRSEPVEIYLLNLSGGDVRLDTFPAFPDAFGPPGTYYSVLKEPETEISLIAKFESHP